MNWPTLSAPTQALETPHRAFKVVAPDSEKADIGEDCKTTPFLKYMDQIDAD